MGASFLGGTLLSFLRFCRETKRKTRFCAILRVQNLTKTRATRVSVHRPTFGQLLVPKAIAALADGAVRFLGNTWCSQTLTPHNLLNGKFIERERERYNSHLRWNLWQSAGLSIYFHHPQCNKQMQMTCKMKLIAVWDGCCHSSKRTMWCHRNPKYQP